MFKTDLQVMKELIRSINYFNDCYFNKNENAVSDREFDRAMGDLAALEDKTGVVYPDSPTRNVGFKSVSNLKKVTHEHKLLSLAKTTELSKFVKYFSGHNFVLMPKLDGITCSLTYDNGVLVRAETRGDGVVGEDITHNAMEIANIPLTISYKEKLYVDGEAVIDYLSFENIKKKENTGYKNPRNLVSGTVRQLNNALIRKRNVSFIAWRNSTQEFMQDNFLEAMEALDSFGFSTVTRFLISQDASEDYVREKMVLIKEEYDFPIDGMVGTFFDQQYGKSLGETLHHPNHSFAYKFYQEQNTTTLLDIEWNTSRTGTINPVAVFEPVEIDGTTVSRASLSNVRQIKKLLLGIGDKIDVIKANQIIPMVVGNITQSNTYQIPKRCPSCGGRAEIIRGPGTEQLVCVNDECPAVLVWRLVNFVSRRGMNIDGLSVERIKILVGKGWLKTFPDIYRLGDHQENMKSLDGFGDASVEKLLTAIENSRHCNAENFITALGIPGVGKSAARIISEEVFKNTGISSFITTLCDMGVRYKDWSKLQGIGSITSDAINEYVEQHLFNVLLPLDNFLMIAKPDQKPSKTSGLTVCVTGKLNNFSSRKEFEKAATSAGHTVVSGVTRDTDFLVCNDAGSKSSKAKKAISAGVKIISEGDFLNNYMKC